MNQLIARNHHHKLMSDMVTANESTQAWVEQYIEQVNNKAKATLEQNKHDQLKSEIKQYITNIDLRNYFLSHIQRWVDVKRKITSIRKKDGEITSSVPPKYHDILLECLLNPDRAGDKGGKLFNAFYSEVIKNELLILACQHNPSVIDMPTSTLFKVQSDKRKEFVGSIIRQSLLENTRGCTEENLGDRFPGIARKIVGYSKSVFGLTYTPQDSVYANIEAFSQYIVTLFEKEPQKAWMLVQNFQAWANIDEVEKTIMESNRAMRKGMEEYLKNLGFTVEGIQESENNEGVSIFTGTIQKNGKTHTISWRGKTIISTLQKKKWKEEYTNTDTPRDAVGISFVFANDTDDTEIKQILKEISQGMEAYGYIFKNKGLISDTDEFKHSLTKKPISSERGVTTDLSNPEIMVNAGFSGFKKMGGKNVGIEWQFSKIEHADRKKEEDTEYKIRCCIDAMMGRGDFYLPSDTICDLMRVRFMNYLTGRNINPNENESIIKHLEEKNILTESQIFSSGKKYIVYTMGIHLKKFAERYRGIAFELGKVKDRVSEIIGGNQDRIFSRKEVCQIGRQKFRLIGKDSGVIDTLISEGIIEEYISNVTGEKIYKLIGVKKGGARKKK